MKKQKMRPYVVAFVFLSVLYCVAMLAIWRSGVSYIDDYGRAISGKGWTSDFNRFSSSALSFLLLQMNLSLVDVSPWSQVAAMAIVAIASVVIVSCFGDVKKPWHVILGGFVALCPFVVSCWLYKFDAPCMALALLASVAPLLFVNRGGRLSFFVASFVGCMVMLTSYQAFSGVFPAMCLGVIFNMHLNRKELAPLLRRLGWGLLAYVTALLVFKFLLPLPVGYRSIEMWGFSDLLVGVISNARDLLVTVFVKMAWGWRIVTCAVLGVFLVSIGMLSGSWKRKVLNICLGMLFIILAATVSYGLYILLAEAPVNARSFVGLGCVLSMLALMTAVNTERANSGSIVSRAAAIPSAILLYMFFIYAFVIGNALVAQEEYARYRNETLARDMAKLYSAEELAAKRVQIQGAIDYAPAVQHVADLYPLTYDIIDDSQKGLSYLFWGSWNLRFDYGLEYDHLGALDERWDCGSMSQKLDGYYHAIYSDDARLCVVVK